MDETKYLKYTINENLSIKDAMILIESSQHRSLVVINDDNIVVGTISDGDIRKSILNGRLLTIKVRDVMNLNFISLQKVDDMEAKKIFTEKHIFLIPVLNESGELVDIVESYQ